MEFRVRLLELIKERGMKQADFCRLTGISTSLMSQYSTGRATPNLEKAEEMARALNVSLDDLVGWKPTKEKTPREQIECTTEEVELVRKYRAIDERGKRTVRRILNAEYEDAMALLSSEDKKP